MLGLVLFLFGLTTLSFSLFHGFFREQLAEYLPYLRFEPLFGLGPALYLYTRNVTRTNSNLRLNNFLILLPAFLEFIYYRTSYYRDGIMQLGSDNMNVLQQIFMVEQWTGFAYSTIFMFLSVYELFKYNKWLYNNFSYTSGISLKWIQIPIICFASFWFLWFILLLSDILIFSGVYVRYYYSQMYIILTLISLWIGFKSYTYSYGGIEGFGNFTKTTNSSPKKDNAELLKIAELLKSKMQSEKYYLTQDLSLKMLSEKMGVREKELSAAINQCLQVNFHEFINTYRVNEFIERIKADSNKQFTFLAHAYESGFSSKSSFNSIFRKQTNKTPREYFSELTI